ncbi:MAG: ATP-binding domain-containing protein, partial [Acidimicrobiales bacterium]
MTPRLAGVAASVLDPPDAKGLEFDAVVVVEPAVIAGGTSRGLRLLYVALTRAV